MSAAGLNPDGERTFKVNLDVLKRSRGGVFDFLDSDPPARLEGGSPPGAAVQAHGGRWVRLHSVRDPQQEADRLVATAFSSGEPPLVVAIGLGLGYVLDAVERRSSTTKVLALEPLPGTMRLLLQRREWLRWIETGRLTLLVGPGYLGAGDGWEVVDPNHPIPFIVSPVLLREFAPAVEQAKRLADRILDGARSNAEARRKFAAQYLLNTLDNLPVICSEGDVSTLFDAFPGVPGIVVAAGPSLDHNIEAIRKVHGRALVIAVDTALRPLLAAGIRPHLVVAVDPQAANAQHLNDLPDTHGIWFVAEGSIDPGVFPQFVGRTFTFKVSDHHPWPWLREHGADHGTLRAWGSVLTSAFDLACRVGCDPIVFAGADLAYTDGLRYCRNTIHERDWSHLTTLAARAEAVSVWLGQRTTSTAPDIRGKSVLTKPDFVQFRDWLVARSVAVRPRRVLNATGAGILHGVGVEQAALGSLVLPKVDVHDFRSRIGAAWQRGRGDRMRAAETLAALSRLDGRGGLPIDRWVDFAAGGASPKDVGVTIHDSLHRMACEQPPEAARGAYRHPRDESARWSCDGVTITPARDLLGDTLIHVIQVREDSKEGWHSAAVFDLGLAGPQSHALLGRPVGRAVIYLQSIGADFVVTFDFRSGRWTKLTGGGDVSAVLCEMSEGWFLCGVSTATSIALTDLRAGVCFPGTDVYAQFQGEPGAGFDIAELVSTPGVEIHHHRLQDGSTGRAS